MAIHLTLCESGIEFKVSCMGENMKQISQYIDIQMEYNGGSHTDRITIKNGVSVPRAFS